MPIFCDDCTKEVPMSDEFFNETGGAICRECKQKRCMENANAMVAAYMARGGADPDEYFTDMLADLFHLIEHKGHNLHTLIKRAAMHYRAERGR